VKLLEEDLHTRPAVTYERRAEFLYRLLGVRLSRSTICRIIKRLGYTRKRRSVGASERDEWPRAAWWVMRSTLDVRRLVFVDEMGTNTSLAPIYAYSLKGHRAHAKLPRNRGPNTTLLASMSIEGMGPALALEGPTTREVFEAYVERVLAPRLCPGQVVIMDNLTAHKGERIIEMIEGRDCQLLYLPPYSPDLNPIEEAFSKIEVILRRAEARTREALVGALGVAISAVSVQDARGFFEHCGYSAV
jgi:transposase